MKKFDAPEDALSYFSTLPHDALCPARHENHLKMPDWMGIYCWFLREEGFALLSQKLPVEFRLPHQTLKVGDAYLIYYGHVGTNKDAETIRTAVNLRFYFQGNLPHKTLDDTLEGYSLLPCFRKTIGGLLCDDLLHEQDAIKAFFGDHLLIHSLGYEAADAREVAEASKATKADFKTIQRALDSLWKTNRVFADMNRKDFFIYDLYAPELRFIVEKRRLEAEINTLINTCTKYKVADIDPQEFITPREVFLSGQKEDAF
jgi:hypothetical protein